MGVTQRDINPIPTLPPLEGEECSHWGGICGVNRELSGLASTLDKASSQKHGSKLCRIPLISRYAILRRTNEKNAVNGFSFAGLASLAPFSRCSPRLGARALLPRGS